MFRPRRPLAPHFRLPNPTNPISGDANYLYPPKKEFTRFVLTEAMTTEDENADAEIEQDSHSWGPEPIYHSPKKIHVHNQLTKDGTTYAFHGEIGDVGIASWDHNMEWGIITMLQQGLRGGCLNEDHPGRGTVFEIHLGTWNPSHASGGKWIYDTETISYAIDWRYGVPYPDEGSTGLFESRASDEYGVIWECVALDCETPGACGE